MTWLFRFSAAVSVAVACAISAGAEKPAAVNNTIETLPRDSAPRPFFSGPIPRSQAVADDASLNDVCAVAQNCWAVGERGVIVRSTDGGNTWSTRVLETDCSLKSVCFLTNQIGYVAGSVFDHFGRRHRGILLKTRDGGETWATTAMSRPKEQLQTLRPKTLNSSDLPPLAFIRFFDLQNAVAIGSPDIDGSDSRILRTADGGASWSLVQCETSVGRLSFAAFASVNAGIVVGHSQTYSAVIGNRAVTLAAPARSFRQVRGASMSADEQCWLAGDGGFLLQSNNGGIDWKPPTGVLSPKLNDCFDYHSVDQRDGQVCVVGSPGGVVLHSENSGKSWSFRAVGNPAAIHRVRFVSPSRVLAVGAFGVIHASIDGGRSWQTVRNREYRAALLCLATEPDSVCFRMLAKLSGDEGFRAVVIQPSTQLLNRNSDPRVTGERMQNAVAAIGANQFTQDWMFARTQPLQGEVRDELLKSWERQTDSRVGQLLPQRLAQMIRTWRPDVLCLDGDGKNDEVAKLWKQALTHAKAIAAGEDVRGEVLDNVGLRPWTVSRVYLKLPDGEQSALTYHAADLLPGLGTSTGLIASESKLRGGLTPLDQWDDDGSNHRQTASYAVFAPEAATAAPRHLLAGFQHARGTAARRQTISPGSELTADLKNILQQDQTLRGAITGTLQRSASPLSLMASLRTIGEKLPPQLALRQLLDLVTLYESIENFEGEIAVLKEITERFPDTPAAAHASEQLFHFYSSGELRFLRRRTSHSGIQNQPIRQVSDLLSRLPAAHQPETEPTGGVIPATGISKSATAKPGVGTLLANSNGPDEQAVDQRWDSNADAAFQVLQRLAPERAGLPETLLRQAANLRRRMAFGENRTVLSEAAAGEGLHSLLAKAELQAVHATANSPIPVVNLPKAKSKPLLDAFFTEECWQDAIELHLAALDTDTALATDCLIMLAWDEEHVYICGRIEFPAGRSNRLDKTAARQHDANHGDRDRVTIAFDTDRDYTTGFHFTIDEAGQTSERCWRSKNWNPEWFAAADADEQVWRFEVAIPVNELQPQKLKEGSTWGLRIQRIVPGVLQQSLTNQDSDAQKADTAGFGLVKFIRNRK